MAHLSLVTPKVAKLRHVKCFELTQNKKIWHVVVKIELVEAGVKPMPSNKMAAVITILPPTPRDKLIKIVVDLI